MLPKLSILLLQPDFSRYSGAYYQHDLTAALARVHRVFRYGPGLDGYDTRHTLRDVMNACPFEPELICFGAGWEVEDMSRPEFDPHPAIRATDCDIPAVMILNKEYKKLDCKLQFVRDNEVRMVFTVHHEHGRWARETGVPFIHFPFGVDAGKFRDYGETRRFALGFSGDLHRRWTDVRSRIKNHVFIRWPLKRRRYWGTRVYWSEWDAFPGLRPPAQDEYGRLLNSSKMWLSTPSAVQIVGPRFYEVLASKTLLFCSRSPVYGDLFRDLEHCVMFDPGLEDFDDKLFTYLRHGDEREAIASQGYAHVMENHTWERRVEQFTAAVCTLS